MHEKFMKTMSDAIVFLAKPELEQVIFASRVEAEEVLGRLSDLLLNYGQVTISDLYKCIGLNNKYASTTYGWTDLRNAHIIATGDRPWGIGIMRCYRLHLPEMIALPSKKQETYATAKECLDDSKDDNNAILEVLGTEYMMMLNRDMATGNFIIEVSDTKNHRVTKTIPMLEVVKATHNVLLIHIKQAILLLEAMDET